MKELSATVPSGHTVRVHKHLRRRRFAGLSSWSSFLGLFKGRSQAPACKDRGVSAISKTRILLERSSLFGGPKLFSRERRNLRIEVQKVPKMTSKNMILQLLKRLKKAPKSDNFKAVFNNFLTTC